MSVPMWTLEGHLSLWFPLGHWTIDCNCLHGTIQPLHYWFDGPSSNPSISNSAPRISIFDHIKGLTKDLTLSTNACIIESHHISQTQSVLKEAFLSVSNHLLIFHLFWYSFQEDLFQNLTRYTAEADSPLWILCLKPLCCILFLNYHFVLLSLYLILSCFWYYFRIYTRF